MNSLNLKKGDEVKVLAGKDKGKTGKILEVLPKLSRVVIEGINIHTRFSKPKKQGEKGQKLQLPYAFNISKVMLICPSCGKPTRIGHDITENGSVRKCRKCGKAI